MTEPLTQLSRSLSLRMADATLARWDPAAVRWHYEDGFLLLALWKLGTDSGRGDYRRFVRLAMEKLVHPDGTIHSYRKEEFNLDQINPGKVLFLLLDDGGDSRYRAALTTLREQLRGQPRCRSGGFWHKKIYPYQMWLDGLYMAGPFYAQYAIRWGEPPELADVVHQFLLVEERTRDAPTGLLYHAWDESRRQLWANPENGRSPCFWSRGMGWYAMALVDLLEILPESQPERPRLVAVLERLLRAVVRHREPQSGVWYQVTDQTGRDGNYPEASATCMFIYALLRACRMGYIVDRSLADEARSAFDSAVARFVAQDESGFLCLTDTCAGAGLGGNPYRDGSYAYYVGEKRTTNDPKGVAAFILASREVEHHDKRAG